MSKLEELIDQMPEPYRDTPWLWYGQRGLNYELSTRAHGRLFIMGFDRMGMHSAQPSFAHRPEGDQWHSMVKGDDLAISEVDYRKDVVGFDNAFATWIAEANPFRIGKMIDRLKMIAAGGCEAWTFYYPGYEPESHDPNWDYCLDPNNREEPLTNNADQDRCFACLAHAALEGS